MKDIHLEKISLKHEHEIYRIKREYDKLNEDYNGAFFIKDIELYSETIKNLDNYSNGIMDNPNYVPYTCYVAITDDNHVVGVGSLRHCLNDYLVQFGGHIGYSVAPSERKKGYGTKMLCLLLKEAKKMNINRILVTCSDDNIGSLKVIENNNGILENKISNNNKTTCRFWINL